MYNSRRARRYYKKKSRLKPLTFVLFVLGVMAMKTYDIGLSPQDASARNSVTTLRKDLSAMPVSPVEEEPAPEPAVADYSSQEIFGPMVRQESSPAQPETPAVPEPVFMDQDFVEDTELSRGNVIDDRDRLNKMLTTEQLTPDKTARLKEQLAALADQWLFSRNAVADDIFCKSYKVQPGDALSRIAKQNDISYQLLMRINKISSPRALRADQTIKIVKGPFHCKVDLSESTLDLYLRNTYVKTFTVSIGTEAAKTPTGSWIVKSSRAYDAQDAAFGTRRITLQGTAGDAIVQEGFAIQGSTKDTTTAKIGVSMSNKDVELIYDMLLPNLSRVTVTD